MQDECPQCGFNEEMSNEAVYRGSAKKQEVSIMPVKPMAIVKPKLTFKQMIQNHEKLIGIPIGFVSVTTAGWLLFPGLYYLGQWCAFFMNWDRFTHEGPVTWMIGFLAIAIIGTPIVSAYPVGKIIIKKFTNKES